MMGCYISPKRETEQELGVQLGSPLPGQAGSPRGFFECFGPGLFEMTRPWSSASSLEAIWQSDRLHC